MVSRSRRALVVLPKWEGHPTWEHEGWIGNAHDLEADAAVNVLSAVGASGTLESIPADPDPAWETRDLPTPTFVTPRVRLLDEPPPGVLIGTGGRALLVEWKVGSRTVMLLADPEPISNAGLSRGRNAELVVAAIERLRPPGGTVVIDETMHGYESPPSLGRRLLAFPLGLASLYALITALALVAAASLRFGAPDRSPPALEPGSRVLIENTADLLRWGGKGATVLRRYQLAVMRDVRARLEVPAHLSAEESLAWIDRIAAERGVDRATSDLDDEVRAAVASGRDGRVLDAANEIHRWRQEIVDGSGTRPRRS
jgi:hypothetical protein